MLSKRIFSVLILLSLFAFYSCVVNPVTGKKEISLMSEQQELALGESANPQILAAYGVYNDEKIQNFIDEKGQEMAAISHRSNIPYHFQVVDSDVINAFALPGGYVYFTRGILAHFNNEAEFAGVLGHEIGHITARHGARQQTTQTLGQIGLVGGMILSPTLASQAQQLSQGMQLLFLKYGRDHETESDKLGVEYSSQIGYDATHMANFFNTLKRYRDKSGQELPTFMSTHPDPGDRFNNVNAMAKAWQSAKPGNYAENRNQYLKLIEGIIYGKDPKQGYVKDGQFIHPELKFNFIVPTGFQVLNEPTQVRMISQNQDAMIRLALAQGDDLNAAAQSIVEGQKITVSGSRETTINGNQAVVFEGSIQGQENSVIPTQNYLIKYGSYIYWFQCLSAANAYATYTPVFQSVGNSFKEETRSDRLNVKPEVIQLRTVNQSMTLDAFLNSAGVPSDRREETALINSMFLSDQLAPGTIIKVIGKQA